MKKRKKNRSKLVVIIAILILIILISYKSKFNNNIISNDISDNVAPILYLDENIILAKGNSFNPNVKAIDNIDGDLTKNIIIEGNVDTSKAGNYNVKYIVSDNSGNKTEKNQKVEIRNELENGLPVLMYHFFYEKDDPVYKEKKPDNNILLIDNFDEQMAYLKQENFYFPTWQEVEDYIDGKINLPEKSVVITDDDGNFTFFVLAVPVIEKYKVPVTSFVITGTYEERLNEKYDFVNYQSHSDDMHKAGSNGKGAMVNWDYNQIVEDLKKSKNKIETYTQNDCTIFCYPFGHYNDTAKKALKDSMYKLGFTTIGGRVKPNDDKFELSRVRVNGNTTIEQFKNLVK